MKKVKDVRQRFVLILRSFSSLFADHQNKTKQIKFVELSLNIFCIPSDIHREQICKCVAVSPFSAAPKTSPYFLELAFCKLLSCVSPNEYLCNLSPLRFKGASLWLCFLIFLLKMSFISI